jgi:hypothetical protein
MSLESKVRNGIPQYAVCWRRGAKIIGEEKVLFVSVAEIKLCFGEPSNSLFNQLDA